MSSSAKKLPKYIVGGVIAGLIVVVLNILWYFLYETFTGIPPAPIITVTGILFSSLIPPILAGVAYWFVSKKFKMGTVVFTIGTAVLVLLSCIPLFMDTLPGSIPIPLGFKTLALPMHLIAGIVTLIAIPYWVKRSKK